MEKYRSHFSPKEWDHYLTRQTNFIPFVAYYIEEWSQQEERFLRSQLVQLITVVFPSIGKLDRIDILGDKCQVVDYKTGKKKK